MNQGPLAPHGTALWCALALAGALLVACVGSSEPRNPEPRGVVGTMVLLDDTGRPPTPDGDARLVVIPQAALPALWRSTDTAEPEDLAYSRFTVTTEVLADLGGGVVPVDGDGRFRIVRTGGHLLCRLPASAGAGLGGVSGCDLVDLPVSGEISASYGEGGFRVDRG